MNTHPQALDHASQTEINAAAILSCEQEPIRIPGSIQPHGFFLGIEHGDNLPQQPVIQVSNNLPLHTGISVDQALHHPLADVIGQENAQQLLNGLAAQSFQFYPLYLGTVALENGGFYDVLTHPQDGMTVFEFEQTSRQAHADFRHLYPLVGNFLNSLSSVSSIEEMSQIAVREFKRLTSYGRILLYRFDEAGHGEVLAEAVDEGYHAYLNQRFPASDIPRQARDLYVINRMRLIADANYTPVALVPAHHPLTGQANDLTHAVLRSVSPVHVQYMKNMGTLSSMSVSIVIKGKLWGLISCHHAEAKPVSFETRAACEQLGQILALHIASKEESDEASERLELRRMLVEMLGPLGKGMDFVGNISGIAPLLMRFAKAGGVALMFGDEVKAFGNTPTPEELQALVAWLGTQSQGIFHTDSLPRLYPAAAAYQASASGILALPISSLHRHYLIWFRPEVIQTIDWAGHPYHKQAQVPQQDNLSPRMSFSLWRETVSGKSRPWNSSEVGIAAEFHTALLSLVLERAEQMAELAEELGRANKELEAFSYSVSHDLRAPMRHIVGFADLLLEYQGDVLNERSQRFIHNIKDSARFSSRLVDGLLSFSQMGRAALHIADVDMNELVRSSLAKLLEDQQGREVECDVAELPVIQADGNFLQLALFNLLSNALKYTRTRSPAKISISVEAQDDNWIFHIADNGVGFPMEFVHKLFGVFQRLHRMEEFEGTGIGLANVKRIIERHGGSVWAEGRPDQGATFSFSLPKQIPQAN